MAAKQDAIVVKAPFDTALFMKLDGYEYSGDTANLNGMIPVGSVVYAIESGTLKYTYDSNNNINGYSLMSADGARFYTYKGINGLNIKEFKDGLGNSQQWVYVRAGDIIGNVYSGVDGISHVKLSVALKKPDGSWGHGDPIEKIQEIYIAQEKKEAAQQEAATVTPQGTKAVTPKATNRVELPDSNRVELPDSPILNNGDGGSAPVEPAPKPNKAKLFLGVLVGVTAIGTVILLAVASPKKKRKR